MMFNSPDNARPKINSPSPVTAVPDELIAEVLSLLKVKSLLRLKCVSKSWNKLISDPFFVKIHFHKSSLNTDLTLFSAHHTGKSTYTQLTVYPVHTLLENNSTTSIVTVIRRFFSNEYHQVVGSCNGLCCLMEEYSNTEFREFSFRLCNPATKSLSHKLGFVEAQWNGWLLLSSFCFQLGSLAVQINFCHSKPLTLLRRHTWDSIFVLLKLIKY
ncbi:F-box/kelch-repeat protein At3g23880 isoform X2 [Lathyrus oleraceus]|nr:F-box/kelch-repeat protein At3g23880-like isoform X2 [Pisum sativum]